MHYAFKIQDDLLQERNKYYAGQVVNVFEI